MANALTIAGSDSVGGAGLQADLKAFEAVGVHCCSVVTCVTSQNTKGVSSIFQIPPEEVSSQIESVLEDVDVNSVKTGMLYSPEIVETVSTELKGHRAPIVVDPVMAATTGSSLSSGGFVDALASKLVPMAALVTPNLKEASELSGMSVKDEKSVIKAGDRIMGLGPKAVLIKGGHLRGPEAIDYLFAKKGIIKFTSPKIQGEVHGTGCTLASLIAAHLAKEVELEDSVRLSKNMMYKAVLAREKVGLGIPCANPLAVLRIEAGKVQMLEDLDDKAAELERLLTVEFIPEVGTNMAYAVLGALDSTEVAAFDGRIVRVGSKAVKMGCAKFGASKHVARIVLAASYHDPGTRAAMNVKFSRDNLTACRRAKLSVSTFDRAKEPKGVSSMTWGVHRAIKDLGRVPDIIYDEGGIGKEPMIRLLGENPADVVSKLRRIVSARTKG